VNHPDVDAWEAWHPRRLVEGLRDLQVPWYVAAGWSVDLFRGEQTRVHEDLSGLTELLHVTRWHPFAPTQEQQELPLP